MDVRRGTHVDAGDDAHGKERGDERAAAVGEERQRQADDRHKADAHADVDEHLRRQHASDADADEPVHIVAGFDADIDNTDDNGRQQNKNRHAAKHTQFLTECAALVHDIGIRPAEEKYGACNGALQEQVGPAYARTLLEELDLELEDMINPEICDLLEQQGRRFVPVSISLDRGAAVITGANMGGKSVAMKTVALNVLLLQAGFLVCAKSARMPLFWSVHMLFDDLQSIQSGLFGFGSEIVQFQKALAEVEQGYSLFLLDEFARGTNPDEGAIIVQAVTRYLNDVNAISLLTTHYDKVAEHARVHYQIIGLRDVDPEQIRRELAATNEDGVAVIARHMNYGLYRVEGRSDCPRDALNICRMLSLKPEILHLIEENY